MATGLALGKLSQVSDLPTRLLYIAGTRQGQTNPVMHPDGQILWVYQQTLGLLRQVPPGDYIHRQLAQHLQTPEKFDALEQRQRRRRVRPVIPCELFVPEDGSCLP